MEIFIEKDKWSALVIGDDLAAIEFPEDGVYFPNLTPAKNHFRLESFAAEVIKRPIEVPDRDMPESLIRQCDELYKSHFQSKNRGRFVEKPKLIKKMRRQVDPKLELLIQRAALHGGHVRKVRDEYHVQMLVEHKGKKEAGLVITFADDVAEYRPASAGIKAATRAKIAFKTLDIRDTDIS
jgi:hypothetical protein